jgi:hypothetical protein
MRRRIVEWKRDEEAQEDTIIVGLALVVFLTLGVMVSLPYLFGYLPVR